MLIQFVIEGAANYIEIWLSGLNASFQNEYKESPKSTWERTFITHQFDDVC